jgi:CheY-like chemotaxis protein
MKKKIILVVDDEPDLHDLLEASLPKIGDTAIEYYKAMDGKEGCEKYVELAKNNLEPNLVLMDLKMPIMDGVESTKKILEKYPNANIYAFTAYGDTEIGRRALDAGARGIIHKYKDFPGIIEEIKKILENE